MYRLPRFPRFPQISEIWCILSKITGGAPSDRQLRVQLVGSAIRLGSAVWLYTVCRPSQMKIWRVSLCYFEFRRFEPSCDFGAHTARTASRYFRSKRAHLPVKTIQEKAFAMLEGLRALGSFALILLVGQI